MQLREQSRKTRVRYHQTLTLKTPRTRFASKFQPGFNSDAPQCALSRLLTPTTWMHALHGSFVVPSQQNADARSRRTHGDPRRKHHPQELKNIDIDKRIVLACDGLARAAETRLFGGVDLVAPVVRQAGRSSLWYIGANKVPPRKSNPSATTSAKPRGARGTRA